MILLRPDCLVFKMSNGDNIPCSVEQVTIELIGESAALLNLELIRHAAAAVLHYFKDELGRIDVSLGEFSLALEHVLRSLGLNVVSADSSDGAPPTAEADLLSLVREAGKGCELFFFPRLRHEVRRHLHGPPCVLRFCGLRNCVKQLTGAKRWSRRCQLLNDQIVEYLRTCLRIETGTDGCALVVL